MEMVTGPADIVAIDLVDVNPVLETQKMTGVPAAELADARLGKRVL